MIKTEAEYFGQFYPEDAFSNDYSSRERERDEFYSIFSSKRIAYPLIRAIKACLGMEKLDSYYPSIAATNKFFLDDGLDAWSCFMRSRNVGVKAITEVVRVLRTRKELPESLLDEFETYARRHGKLK